MPKRARSRTRRGRVTALPPTLPSWTFDQTFVQANGAVSGGWTDYAAVWRPGDLDPGDSYDTNRVTSNLLGWATGFHGRSGVYKDLGVGDDDFEIELQADDTLMSGTSLAFSQHSVLTHADGTSLTNQGLSFMGDVTTNINGPEGSIWGWYIWKVTPDHPNIEPGVSDVEVYQFNWPAILPNLISSDTMKILARFRNGEVAYYLNGVRCAGPIPVPTTYAGRVLHGIYHVQGFSFEQDPNTPGVDPVWSDFSNIGWARRIRARAFSGSLGAPPVAPTIGAVSSSKFSATTAVRPVWPAGVAAGVRVCALIHRTSAVANTPPTGWYTNTGINQTAGQQIAVYEWICDGTEQAGALMPTFTNASSVAGTWATFTVTNPHPYLYGFSYGGLYNDPASTNIVSPDYTNQGRWIQVLWIGLATNTTITPPAGFTEILNTGVTGAHTNRIVIARDEIGLAADEFRNTINFTGTLGTSLNSLCGLLAWHPDPR